MTVLLNKWDGEGFAGYAFCYRCLQAATLSQIQINGILYGFCKSCLLAMAAEIDEAVLGAVTSGEIDR